MSVFTIDAIEGNSHIGVPVFSSSGRKSNYNYRVFSPQKQPEVVEFGQEDENRPYRLRSIQEKL